MKFAHDVSTRVFFMMDGVIHEDGTPQQIFENPVHSATKAFVNRIQKLVYEVDSDDFDFLKINTEIRQFCIKYNIAEKTETANALIQEMLFEHLPKVRPITVRLTHTEISGVTALDFMVEHLDESPLPPGVGDDLRQRFKDVIEEPTTRGFRVKIVL
jgi:ABC-type sulfate/molybdate transport systems ATPase subunit